MNYLNVMLKIILLSVIMLNVIMLSVVRQSVRAPYKQFNRQMRVDGTDDS